ncbi:MAG: DUF4832 domain-containing protein [Chitinophagaceae bacterium]|nr:DUF4832 domain-containing protein [Chitinophagaceae bacterium]
MKKILPNKFAYLFVFAFLITSRELFSQSGAITEFNALEMSQPLINPFGGLVNYGLESCYGDYLRKIPDYIYPESIVYLRPVWGDLEPEEGKLDLRLFEDIRDRHLRGGARQWCFRVVTALGGAVFKHATPDWVKKAGAKGTVLAGGGWEPQYGDSLYLQKFDAFIQNMARRYDGDPSLAFVDISGFGLYGEWGDPASEQEGWADNDSLATMIPRKIIDIYLKAFRKTPLTISTHITGPHGEDRYSVQYALDRGVWLRRDGVGSPFYHQGHKELARKYWEDRPIITEWYGIYGNYNDTASGRNKNWSGWSFTDAVDQALDEHGLMAEMSRDLDTTDAVLKTSAFKLLAEKTGYRLVLAKAFFPKEIKNGESIILRQLWKNQGVSRLYVKHALRVFLIDNKGKEAWSAIDPSFDPTGWSRGSVYEEYSQFSGTKNIPSGTYQLKIALTDPMGQPAIALGMEGGDRQLRYYLGEIKISEATTVPKTFNRLSINLARLPSARGYVKIQTNERPFYYVAPLNDGVMRVSVSDSPGNLRNSTQAFGIIWDSVQTFNNLKFFSGRAVVSEGGWFERDCWVEVLQGGNWQRLSLAAWVPVYPFDERSSGQVYTISFNKVEARGIRICGYAGRRHSKWVSVREIEVYND